MPKSCRWRDFLLEKDESKCYMFFIVSCLSFQPDSALRYRFNRKWGKSSHEDPRAAYVAVTYIPVLDCGDILHTHVPVQALRMLYSVFHASLCLITNSVLQTHHCELSLLNVLLWRLVSSSTATHLCMRDSLGGFLCF